MTLVIEDGSNVAGANSYVTEQEYTDWAGHRYGYDRATATNPAGFVLRAMDEFERNRFIGYRANASQALMWPRAMAEIDGMPVDVDEIPAAVKAAVFEIAYLIETGVISPARVKKEKIDSFEREYFSGTSYTIPSLSKLVRSSYSSFQVRRG
jgi:hypothetical protein